MFKKFILLIISLFLFVPASFADDSSIVPVLWLFTKNNDIEHKQLNEVFNDNGLIYEMTGKSSTLNSTKITKTYYLSIDGNVYEMTGNSSMLDSTKITKTYYLF